LTSKEVKEAVTSNPQDGKLSLPLRFWLMILVGNGMRDLIMQTTLDKIEQLARLMQYLAMFAMWSTAF